MHEIIHVVDAVARGGTLRQGLEIEAVDDHPLAAGYYFVLWTKPTRSSGSRRDKRYFGPFATRSEARMLQRSAVALGLVPAEPVMLTVAECRSTVRRPPPKPVDAGYPVQRMPWQQETACAA